MYIYFSIFCFFYIIQNKKIRIAYYTYYILLYQYLMHTYTQFVKHILLN